MITVVKDAILEHLNQNIKNDPNFKGFQATEFPDKFEQFSFTSAKGCLLVRDDGSGYSKPETINKILQGETVRVSVIIGLRYLKDEAQQYTFIRNVIGTLSGLQILSKRLYPTKREYLGQLGQDFWHGVQFEITLPSGRGVNNVPPVFAAG